MLTERERAELGGQPPVGSQQNRIMVWNWNDRLDVIGLQLVYVWAEVSVTEVIKAATATTAGVRKEIYMANMTTTRIR